MGRKSIRGKSLKVVVLSAIIAMATIATGCASPLVGVLHGQSGQGRGNSQHPSTPTSCKQPAAGDGFQRVDPADVDMDSRAVSKAIAYASARGAQSVRVFRHDCLVGTSWLDPTTEHTPLPAWSMTKGVVSIIAGRAFTEGRLDIDALISRYLDGLDEAHGAITVRNLLTQTSGLRFAWANDLNAAGSLDSAERVLTRPFEAAPGTKFIYAQTTITALVAVVEAAVGEDFQAYAEREVFEPLGIRSTQWHWGRDGSGRTQGFAFLDMTPMAFARLGSLLLSNGVWNGRRIISAEYIAQGSVGTSANPSYGFLWRTNNAPPGVEPTDDSSRETLRAATDQTFWLSGMFNQNVFVVPEYDIVVVRMGLPADVFGDPYGESPGRRPEWEHRFFRTLLGGLTDVEVPDPGPWVPDPPSPPAGLEANHIIGFGF